MLPDTSEAHWSVSGISGPVDQFQSGIDHASNLNGIGVETAAILKIAVALVGQHDVTIKLLRLHGIKGRRYFFDGLFFPALPAIVAGMRVLVSVSLVVMIAVSAYAYARGAMSKLDDFALRRRRKSEIIELRT